MFWGVNLRNGLFRDADVSGVHFFHTLWSNVSIDGVINGLVVNGVDVTDFVNTRDRWFPLRTQLEPSNAADLCSVWTVLQDEWSTLLRRVAAMQPDTVLQSVDGEWSLRDTLRHLVFAMDKWFTWPILGEHLFSPIGLPNSESKDGDWPGLDHHADPSFGDVLAIRNRQLGRFTDYIEHLDVGALPETSDVLENGSVSSLMCFHVVLEEEFEHLRYALRDLDILSGLVR